MSGPIHPLDGLAEQFGDRSAALMLATAALAPAVILPTGHPAAPVSIILAVVVYATSGGLDLADTGMSEVEAVNRLYSTGEISLEEHERRMDLLLDDERQRLRSLAEDVHGVGPETSAALAREFETVEQFKRAGVEDLREIHGVGRSTAERVAREVGAYGETATGSPAVEQTGTDPLEPEGSGRA